MKEPGWTGKSIAPKVFPMYVSLFRLHGTARTRLTPEWIEYFHALNPGFRAWRYIKGIQAGLFNTAGFPQLESLTCGGNLVRIREVREVWGEEWCRIFTMDYYGDVPSVEKVNNLTHPWLVHRFVCITWDERIVDPPPGPIYFPLVAKVPLWMPLSSFYV
jgi:hypothetical protein